MFHFIKRSWRASRRLHGVVLVVTLALVYACDGAGPAADTIADSGFDGVIGRTLPESVPDWPDPVTAPEGAPNVVIWLLDDAGYAHFSPYGSPIETPTIERLAADGLTFTDFHSIPLCSPARAALLAGRNHHSIAMGSHIMSTAGFPGYNGDIPRSAASIGRILRDAGFATFAIGKWDQTKPTAASVAGPFDSWPSGQGFDRFYGFIGADAHHFAPSLWSDHTPVSPAEHREDYFLTTDLADNAIDFITGLRATAPDKPFLLYWSTGAVHAPHHAPRDFIEKYDSVFEIGWDAVREDTLQRQIEAGIVPPGTRLAPPHDEVPRWAALSNEERRLYARQMAAFAGQLEHADRQFGRVVDLLESLGELDNTIIIVTSDNGASGEGGMTGLHNEILSLNGVKASFEANNRFYDEWGGPNTVNHFHTGWGMAGNTPFPYFKHHVDGGGTHVPLIVHWPDRIQEPGVRKQYHHIIDIVPTILDALGVDVPSTVGGVEQQAFDGISMMYALATPIVSHSVRCSTTRSGAIAVSTRMAGKRQRFTMTSCRGSARFQANSRMTSGACTTSRKTFQRVPILQQSNRKNSLNYRQPGSARHSRTASTRSIPIAAHVLSQTSIVQVARKSVSSIPDLVHNAFRRPCRHRSKIAVSVSQRISVRQAARRPKASS